jgi:hypothetical protein
MNEASSRSHCIVTVTVEKCCPDGSVLVGKLKMVDLAGRWASVMKIAVACAAMHL